MKILIPQKNLIHLINSTLIAAFVLVTGCKKNNDGPVTVKGLKDYYSQFFPIGASVSPSNLTGDEAILLSKEFNSITAENAMKPSSLHPSENTYNWTDADKIVNFAVTNGMKIRGHTLCWHNQTGAWMFVDASGNTVTKDVLLQRLKDHITTVVSRYKGKVYAWDVVNEAIDDDNSRTYRESNWYKICGEEYITKAFQWAHEADPDAILFYNDYSTESAAKREKIYTMLKNLLAAGVPVHGIGMQGHWSIYWPAESDIIASLARFSSLGIKIQITELDVSVYSSSANFSVRTPGDDAFTSDMEQKQTAYYKTIFQDFRIYKNVITGVTFWNLSDRHSWLDSYPVANRKNYPLLFDQNLQPKKAYWGVVEF